MSKIKENNEKCNIYYIYYKEMMVHVVLCPLNTCSIGFIAIVHYSLMIEYSRLYCIKLARGTISSISSFILSLVFCFLYFFVENINWQSKCQN